MNKEKVKNTLIGIGKDFLLAFVIVSIVMVCLYAYCGIWPPMVVVESGSMQRFDERSVVGVIDTGDMVFVKKVNGTNDVVTYVDGEATDYSKYGTYGDVIIYRPNGLTERSDGTPVTPIIHRLVVWIDVNETMANPDFDGIDYANLTFDVPSLSLYGTLDVMVLENYGHWKDTVRINLGSLMVYYEYNDIAPHGGYITMGDNNAPFYDQPQSGSYEPILPEWIVGKAVGEIPWFGLIKLRVTGGPLHNVPRNSWVGLYATIFLLLFLPFMLDILAPRVSKWRMKRKDGKAPAARDDGLPPAEGESSSGEKRAPDPGKEPKTGEAAEAPDGKTGLKKPEMPKTGAK